MKLHPSEDDILIGELALRYLRERATRSERHDPALWAEFADMGWLAMPLDEADGGIAATAFALALLIEAFGRERVNEPYATSVVWALELLRDSPDDHARELAGEIARGAQRAAVVDRGITLAADKLDGAAPLVPGGESATAFLVLVDREGVPALYLVPAGTLGLTVTPVDTIDGSDAADLLFEDVALPPRPLDCAGNLTQRLARARDRTAALLCADAVGAMTALLEKTGEYTRTRQQFGKPLRSFQVVDHSVADMQILVEEARSAMLMAIAAIDAGDTQRQRAVSAARVKIGMAGRRVGHMAVQLHGAMGVTDELDIGAYLKRLIAFDASFGSRQSWLDAYGELARNGATGLYLAGEGEGTGLPDLGLSSAGANSRKKMRNVLDGALPAEIARAQALTPTVYAEPDIAGRWQTIAYGHGFAAPNWPVAFGGTGWSPEERYIWAHESGRRNVPFTSPIGLPLVGPVLMHFGTAEQQQRYLPSIVDGSELWAQGFSEPGAGSDLAALAMRAVRDGDEYVVTGSKIWTTHGHHAHLMAALVRTGARGGRREGISFLIIDMQSAGIEVRPITTIGGDHEVNQIFFDEVRVPAGNLVGSEGQGWAIAKFLLEYERGGDIMSAGHRALLNEIREIALARGEQSSAFWQAFALASIDIDVLEMMELRTLFGVAENDTLPSILKVRASEGQQAVTELGVDLLGPDLLRRFAQRPLYDDPAARPEQAFAARYLNSRANTIFGGAREIQKGLIARTAP